MVEEFLPKDKSVSFEQIVLNHVQDLAKLSQSEYRGGYVDKKVTKNIVEEVYVPDGRKKMIQAIEFLEIMLSPRFEKDEKEKKEVTEKEKKAYDEIMDSMAKNLKDYGDKKINQDHFVTKKLDLSLKLFRWLMFFLHKSGYLKRKAVFG